MKPFISPLALALSLALPLAACSPATASRSEEARADAPALRAINTQLVQAQADIARRYARIVRAGGQDTAAGRAVLARLSAEYLDRAREGAWAVR